MSPASYELTLHPGGVTMLLHVAPWERESLEFHSSSKDSSYVPALPFVGFIPQSCHGLKGRVGRSAGNPTT